MFAVVRIDRRVSRYPTAQDELAFYTHDMNGRFMYLSKSGVRVLNHNPARWLERPFWDALTDNPCNDHIRSCEWKSQSEPSVAGRICEIFDRDGQRVRLKCWSVHVLHEGVPIGLTGIVRRLQDCSHGATELSEVDEKELMAKVATLSDVEERVIELVIDGSMNKKMAVILDVAVRTIESRRARAMAKLKTRTLSELVQLWVHVRRIRARNKSTNDNTL